ncbi:helicase [Tritrichomonas foetus]|uniref:RNA helicase n=1 Tax=Tritrichomonas foetus TaxID=1144522 RepID=A0A1J4KR77_9EUKA|nr:helicase [Tritrichomonas foetus]|eukprot:OHT13793.1 helicase [Tritrichomonas foetus]
MRPIDKARELSRRNYLQKRTSDQTQQRKEYINDLKFLAQSRPLTEAEKQEIELEEKILEVAEEVNKPAEAIEYQLNQENVEGDTLVERLKNISKQYSLQEEINPELRRGNDWEAEKMKSAGVKDSSHLIFERPDLEIDIPEEFDYTPIQQSLPVYKYKETLLNALKDNQILIVVGDTGSGKTTQIPQYLLLRGPNESVVCTQPRRVAAVSVAQRVALERHSIPGNEVGYCVRFDDCTSDKTRIRYCTDGYLLREFLVDPLLSKYTTIMIDEAHERSISTDLLLSLLKDLVLARPELRLVISSATIDAEKMSSFFNNAPVLHVPGRRFTVDVNFSQKAEPDYCYAALLTALHIHRTTPIEQPCDILVFLTGQEEIDDCVSKIVTMANNAKLPPLIALPIYAALPGDKQARIFRPAPRGTRKIVFATNIAETSITIDSIRYVIDSGFVKQTTYDPKSGCESLATSTISVSSAQQRAGRAGRVNDGICYRLFTSGAFENEMPKTTKPEILRCNFAPTLLLLLSIGINTIVDFNFIDPPPVSNIQAAYEQLYAMCAIDCESRLTELGAKLVQLPVSPYAARAIIESFKLKCSDAVCTICAVLESGSPLFYAPKEEMKEAETTIRAFWDHEGDHITVLNAYRAWEQSNESAQWCHENHIQYRTLRKAQAIKEQLLQYAKLLGLQSEDDELTLNISKAFCYGFFQNSAQLASDGSYQTIKGLTQVDIHPSSCLKSDPNPPTYCVYYELASTSKMWMRTVIRIDPLWLKEAAPHLFKIINGPTIKVSV